MGLTEKDVAYMQRVAGEMPRWIRLQGIPTGALGTAIRHLDALDRLYDAYQTGNWKLYETIRKGFNKEFGDGRITSIELAAKVISPEIIKAMGVAGAGGERERETLEAAFDPAAAPDVRKRGVATLKDLLAGKLVQQRNQSQALGVPTDIFKHIVGEEEYKLLHKVEEEGRTGKPAEPGKPAAPAAPAVPPGKYDGEERTFEGGLKGRWDAKTKTWKPVGSAI